MKIKCAPDTHIKCEKQQTYEAAPLLASWLNNVCNLFPELALKVPPS
jgi:hypothetical protein